jgi:hypothetical protein
MAELFSHRIGQCQHARVSQSICAVVGAQAQQANAPKMFELKVRVAARHDVEMLTG